MSVDTDLLGLPTLSEEDEDHLYPGDVEEAMPEGELSSELTTYVKFTIRRLSMDSDADSVHVNMPIYYRQGTRQLVAPDLFYVRGVPYDLRRRSYRLWRAKVPHVVFEIVSRHHEVKDVEMNRHLYERIGVQEYYWFNPDTEILCALELDPDAREYRERKPNSAGRHESRQLGLEIGLKDGLLAIFHRGEYVPHPLELLERFQGERDEASRQRDEAARQRDEAARQRDEAARQRDEAARQRDDLAFELEAERRRRLDLEARLREFESR